jgi:hypothetical protein
MVLSIEERVFFFREDSRYTDLLQEQFVGKFPATVAYPGFFSRGGQQIQLRKGADRTGIWVQLGVSLNL